MTLTLCHVRSKSRKYCKWKKLIDQMPHYLISNVDSMCILLVLLDYLSETVSNVHFEHGECLTKIKDKEVQRPKS